MIDSGPSGVIGVSSVSFTFHGSDTNDTFQCSLDGAPWASCTSPQQYSSLAEGAHTFKVRAVNAAGEVDPTPASTSFTVEATPPQTTITSAPSGRVPIGEVSISFTSTESSSTFQCSLDGASYSPCSSPDVVKDPAAGPHTFNVQATNQAGVKETAGAAVGVVELGRTPARPLRHDLKQHQNRTRLRRTLHHHLPVTVASESNPHRTARHNHQGGQRHQALS